MVCSAGRSKAVFPVLVLLFVVYSTKQFFFKFCLFFFFFFLVFSPFSIAITSLREERATPSAFRTFVRFVIVWFHLFPLPLGVWEGLRLVNVVLSGFFPYHFYHYQYHKESQKLSVETLKKDTSHPACNKFE